MQYASDRGSDTPQPVGSLPYVKYSYLRQRVVFTLAETGFLHPARNRFLALHSPETECFSCETQAKTRNWFLNVCINSQWLHTGHIWLLIIRFIVSPDLCQSTWPMCFMSEHLNNDINCGFQVYNSMSWEECLSGSQWYSIYSLMTCWFRCAWAL